MHAVTLRNSCLFFSTISGLGLLAIGIFAYHQFGLFKDMEHGPGIAMMGCGSAILAIEFIVLKCTAKKQKINVSSSLNDNAPSSSSPIDDVPAGLENPNDQPLQIEKTQNRWFLIIPIGNKSEAFPFVTCKSNDIPQERIGAHRFYLYCEDQNGSIHFFAIYRNQQRTLYRYDLGLAGQEEQTNHFKSFSQLFKRKNPPEYFISY